MLLIRFVMGLIDLPLVRRNISGYVHIFIRTNDKFVGVSQQESKAIYEAEIQEII